MTRLRLARWARALALALLPVAALAMVGLGVWQLSRLEQRRAQNVLIAQRMAQPPLWLTGAPLMNVDELEHRQAQVRGEFDFAHEIVWKGQAYGGASGLDVITPLRIAGGDVAVLVNRGWISYLQAEPDQRAVYHLPTGEVEITGRLRRPDVRTSPLLPADPPLGPAQPRLDAWFWLDVDQIQKQIPYRLLPLILDQAAGADPAQLPISGDAVDLSDGPHLGYAVQWFAFAAIALAGPLVYWRASRRPRS